MKKALLYLALFLVITVNSNAIDWISVIGEPLGISWSDIAIKGDHTYWNGSTVFGNYKDIRIKVITKYYENASAEIGFGKYSCKEMHELYEILKTENASDYFDYVEFVGNSMFFTESFVFSWVDIYEFELNRIIIIFDERKATIIWLYPSSDLKKYKEEIVAGKYMLPVSGDFDGWFYWDIYGNAEERLRNDLENGEFPYPLTRSWYRQSMEVLEILRKNLPTIASS